MATTTDLDRYVFESSPEKSKDVHLEDFKHGLNDEFARVFPTTERPYDNVQVLLLCWDEADSNNYEDVVTFRNFFKNSFHYQTRIYRILGDNFGRGQDWTDLSSVLQDFRNQSTPRTLNIIYYSGHGYSNASFRKASDSQKDLIIFPTKETNEQIAELPGFGLDYFWLCFPLSTINGPILHILDTCCGGGAALSTTQEILAAGSYNTRTQRRRWSAQQPSETQLRGQEPHSHFLRLLLPTMAGLCEQKKRAFTAEELFRGLNTACAGLQKALHGQPWYIKGTGYPSVTFTKLVPPAANALTEKLLFEVDVPKGAAEGDGFRRWMRSSDRPEYISDIRVLGYAVGKELVSELAGSQHVQ